MAVSGLVAALVTALVITAIFLLCAGSATASKPHQIQESESVQTSNMNHQGTSVRSVLRSAWNERPREEPVLHEGAYLVSCAHLSRTARTCKVAC